uniref:Migration and invasion enhancer 1 n=1 Tax=Nannospalax galili TaxID=1026970 RepID=A0A8C6S1C9_NANGA
MSGEPGQVSVAPPPREEETGSGVHIVVEYCETCSFETTYNLKLVSAVKEEYPGAFEIEINRQLVFSKLENEGFSYEKDLTKGIRRALEKITNSRPPCVIL